ncbi:MAG: hypothetical protein OXF85_01075 [Candidatus Saccharibacteria bacterium]|nr:hypothetical protein [Candidatus Saccharibacteria bacterium]MCY4010670.1 hypothetical protein [Candidatus Saccharibacteria bacterium]MCY4088619.1 hypothetical protein [Candidatus Saccharibacteria bacterium]
MDNRLVRYTFYLIVAVIVIAIAQSLFGIYGILLGVIILFGIGKYLTR